MQDKSKIPVGFILWGCALLLGVIAIANRPQKAKLIQAQEQVVKLSKDYQEQKKEYLANTPLKDNFDLVKAQSEASESLSIAFKTGLGEIHNNDDWKAQKGHISSALGNKLTDALYHHAYNAESKKYVIDKNTQTLVAFRDIANRHNAIINVIVKYDLVGGESASYLYRINYDLVNHQVLRYAEESFE